MRTVKTMTNMIEIMIMNMMMSTMAQKLEMRMKDECGEKYRCMYEDNDDHHHHEDDNDDDNGDDKVG